ncbi:MAG: T9SS type A sorting domain-containing protein [Bacteroidetes bacterium]|nr:T9SS type A sorting domain-containing protein [Bacteroidota bacterium]
MKKLLLFSASTIFVTLSVIEALAQNAIPNPGFENWTNQGSYDDPSGGWGTIADISGGFVVNCYKAPSPDMHSGTYACKLITKNIPFQGEAPGIVVTGTINQSTMGVDGGVLFNLKPDSMAGWYKYSPVGVDTASVDVRLSYWNGTSRVQVAEARFEKTTAVSSYARFSVPFIYAVPNTPDTMVIVLMSSYGGATSANTNSTAYYDDLDLIYNTTAVNEQILNASVSVYPNPSSEFVIFSGTCQKFMLKISDEMGKQIMIAESDSRNYKLDVSTFPKGIYFYELLSGEAGKIQRGKFIVQK